MGRVHFRPIAPDVLASTLADDLAARGPDGYLSVAIDGPPPARPDRLAAGLVDPLRARGRAALAVATSGFLRCAGTGVDRESMHTAYYPKGASPWRTNHGRHPATQAPSL